MPTPPRRCSTCRHFQAAPLWRKGWCRHPLLYAPHQNHLVDERDLDCQRQFGDYWEPIDSDAVASTAVAAVVTPAPRGDIAPPPDADPAGPHATATTTDATVDTAPPPHVPGATTPGMQPSRTDRMRLFVPVIIIAGLVLGYLLWTGVQMQSAGDVPTPTASVGQATAPPAGVSTPATAAPTAAPTVAPTAAPTARPTTPTAPVAAGASPTRVATPIGVRAGAAALVDTGSNDGLRLRRDAGSAGVVLRSIRNGERVSVLDGPRDADGITWWRVAYAGDEGWVAGQYLKPAAS